jgi:hypothetical protein
VILIDEIVDEDHFIEVVMDKKDFKQFCDFGYVKQKILLDGEVISLAVIAENDIRTPIDWIGRTEENLIFRRQDERRRKKTTPKSRDECKICKLEFKRNSTDSCCTRKNVRPKDDRDDESVKGDKQTAIKKRKISILKEDEYGRRRAIR